MVDMIKYLMRALIIFDELPNICDVNDGINHHFNLPIQATFFQQHFLTLLVV